MIVKLLTLWSSLSAWQELKYYDFRILALTDVYLLYGIVSYLPCTTQTGQMIRRMAIVNILDIVGID